MIGSENNVKIHCLESANKRPPITVKKAITPEYNSYSLYSHTGCLASREWQCAVFLRLMPRNFPV